MSRKIENNTTISQRLKQFVDYKGFTINKFSALIGASNSYFNKVFSKNTNIGSDRIEKILEEFEELSAEWLLTGKGKMLKSSIYEGMTDEDFFLGEAYTKIHMIGEAIKLIEFLAEKNNLKVKLIHYNKILKNINRPPYTDNTILEGLSLKEIHKEISLISKAFYEGVLFDLFVYNGIIYRNNN